MVQQSQGVNDTGTRQQEVSKREARAHRILDAASTLILRWGYAKTTVDDISKEAGVAKGTIYLHWKTREDLFAALLRREKLEMARDIKERIAADPIGITLRGMIKHSTIATLKRPLMKASFMQDINVLGKLAQSSTSYEERLAGFKIYLEQLREQGLVRSDQDPEIQIYTFSAIFTGFLLVNSFLPERSIPSDEDLAELLADTVHRTLESDNPVSPAALQAISDNFFLYMDRSIAKAQERLQREIE